MSTILEYASIQSSTLRVDRDAHRLRGVKILGLRSSNGRDYAADALRAALPLYEGAKVNVNHPTEPNLTAPRAYQDRLGTLADVRLDEADGLFGDLVYNPMHPLAEQLLWDAEHAPHNVGLSHNVRAKLEQRGGRATVVEILSVVGVDLVADPATTRGLFEQIEQEGVEQEVAENAEEDALPPSESLIESELHEARGRIETLNAECAALRTECAELREQRHAIGGERDALQLERETLREQFDAAQRATLRAERAALAKTILREFGLPDPDTRAAHSGTTDQAARVIVDRPFWESLLDCADESALRRRIAERVQLLEHARRWDALATYGAHSTEQGGESAFANNLHRAETTRRFAQALKRG